MDKLASAGRIGAAGDEETRVLHRLDVHEGLTGEGRDVDARLGVAVDVDTTGTVFEDGVIIELAIRSFRFDRDGVITFIGRGYSWCEDPGVPLSAETTAITGLTDREVSGHCIDDAEAIGLLRSASLVVAHHAAFDRPYVERRLEGARGLDWACTFRQVDWRARGFDGRTLGYLIQQAGYFYRPHRASIDVDAVIQMLRVRDEDGRTVLAELVAKAETPSWIVSAEGASFEAKDALKARGYRWDPDRRVWWTEISDDARTAEEFWLAANVYDANRNARSMAPRFPSPMVVGFSCDHVYDVVPGELRKSQPSAGAGIESRYRDDGYVAREIRNLAAQLAAIRDGRPIPARDGPPLPPVGLEPRAG